MAQQLDLQEQEQVDALKAFWASYGNLIMWTVTLVLAVFAGWSWWQKLERDKSLQASTMYGELQSAAAAGDDKRAAQIFGDMKSKVAKTTYTQLGGLLADAKKYDDALKQLALVKPASFAPLVSDRRGDIELAQGQTDAAVKAYKVAYDGLPDTTQYRILVEAKLTRLGAAPAASAASGAASGAAQ